MDLNRAYVSHATVTGNTFICAKNTCRAHNITPRAIAQQQTVSCNVCNSKQYRGGDSMFLGVDAFTEEMDLQGMLGEFSCD